jgi:hypothetical protein
MDEPTGRAERLLQHSKALSEDMKTLAGDFREVGEELRERVDLSRAIQAHPFRAVFIATGVGYVLGGGLFTPLTGQLLRVASRAMLVPILRSQLDTMLAGATGSQDTGRGSRT